uniref:Peptidase C19 ubiquitin carboxyl-terminal hydrolase domain-containing protein n=1 Tax=Meloidogyne incognita TaxID=6306 RepID=A0A914MIF0_MELIC
MSSKNAEFSWKQCIDDERCKVFPCIKGLKNYGNTDYFNALMQCLAGCDRFAEFLLCNDFAEYEEVK